MSMQQRTSPVANGLGLSHSAEPLSLATSSYSITSQHSCSTCKSRKSGLALTCFTMLAVRSLPAPARRQCLKQSSRTWAASVQVCPLLMQCRDASYNRSYSNTFNQVQSRYVTKDFKPKDEVAKFHGQKDSNVSVQKLFDSIL
jgi:hypothetical protein